MANFSKSLNELVASHLNANTKVARSYPLVKDTTLVFAIPQTDEEANTWVQTEEGGWNSLHTIDGRAISVASIVRIGNGLPYTSGKEVAMRLAEFASWEDVATHQVTLRVVRVDQRQAIGNNGEPQMRNYYVFEYIGVPATEAN